jgi:hypothetical protein
MEQVGVPIDTVMHRRMVNGWEPIKAQLVVAIDPDFGVYDGLTFKADRFGAYLQAAGIDWPRFPSGHLMLDDTTFRDQTLRWPQLLPLHELRATLANLRLTGLEVGADGRNRCLLSPFGPSRAATSRATPSSSSGRRDGCAG